QINHSECFLSAIGCSRSINTGLWTLNFACLRERGKDLLQQGARSSRQLLVCQACLFWLKIVVVPLLYVIVNLDIMIPICILCQRVLTRSLLFLKHHYPTPAKCGGAVSVPNLVIDVFFNGITSQTSSSCAGRRFYTGFAFFSALKSNANFRTRGSSDDTKREVVAFFANVTHEIRQKSQNQPIVKQAKYDHANQTSNTTEEDLFKSHGTTTTDLLEKVLILNRIRFRW
ncbi:Endochitinase EP3, partial [Bienertia sinuspersici]